ncbi:DUF3306 domain-containing protein [Sulfitobacter sp.]|uniref:DUF3306 domain-containing protein n=1 Tax=Sulfitobacter sp. TaxID=1903071 RepID=UPI003001411A
MTKAHTSWSRRRAAVAQEAAAEELAAEEAVIAKQHEALAEKSDAEILEDLGLPDPDTMVQGDDFKAFLTKTVPAHLRKRALRNLWRSNPVLACVDGLNDYDDDYLTGSFGQGPISTSYQVGKGMLFHLLEMERQKEATLSPDEEADMLPETQDSVCPEDYSGLKMVQADVEVPLEVEKTFQEEEPMMPTPRRMIFHFEDDAV